MSAAELANEAASVEANPITLGRPLVSIPQHAEWDDVLLMWVRQVSPHRYPGIVDDACERLLKDSERSGRLLGLGVHPWMLGQASRIRYLDEALQRILRRDGIWNATATEVAEHSWHSNA